MLFTTCDFESGECSLRKRLFYIPPIFHCLQSVSVVAKKRRIFDPLSLWLYVPSLYFGFLALFPRPTLICMAVSVLVTNPFNESTSSSAKLREWFMLRQKRHPHVHPFYRLIYTLCQELCTLNFSSFSPFLPSFLDIVASGGGGGGGVGGWDGRGNLKRSSRELFLYKTTEWLKFLYSFPCKKFQEKHIKI